MAEEEGMRIVATDEAAAQTIARDQLSRKVYTFLVASNAF